MKQEKPQTDAKLREFGLVMSLAFTIIGSLSFWKWKAVTKVFLACLCLTSVFLPLGLLAPRTLVKPERYWMIFAEKLGSVMTVVIMGLTYLFLVVPIGLLMRLIRKDLLALKIDKSQNSYWVPVDQNGSGSRYFLPY